MANIKMIMIPITMMLALTSSSNALSLPALPGVPALPTLPLLAQTYAVFYCDSTGCHAFGTATVILPGVANVLATLIVNIQKAPITSVVNLKAYIIPTATVFVFVRLDANGALTADITAYASATVSVFVALNVADLSVSGNLIINAVVTANIPVGFDPKNVISTLTLPNGILRRRRSLVDLLGDENY